MPGSPVSAPRRSPPLLACIIIPCAAASTAANQHHVCVMACTPADGRTSGQTVAGPAKARQSLPIIVLIPRPHTQCTSAPSLYPMGKHFTPPPGRQNDEKMQSKAESQERRSPRAAPAGHSSRSPPVADNSPPTHRHTDARSRIAGPMQTALNSCCPHCGESWGAPRLSRARIWHSEAAACSDRAAFG
ncbi:hypothetical protein PICMEDRAFT_124232 [Pichia membranifaciens NRRL Y-2026]|uniref:Secreted protein n=1 Tax=Pichia membranifaciens NRRL Y-2026 TaxID=763406 RepID=A0A1E3NQ61_9ASCO|nr:hypothetical protein PICMEDRAFT_124232 [Pichia membranifaciens NRRL Y-2026]ODQ48176.1 hypothetical protein PICMEDRAFT_124232 [Pichia membranifaciens NRRL Y-2026]